MSSSSSSSAGTATAAAADSHKNMVVAVRIRPLSHKELGAGVRPCCRVFNNRTVIIEKEQAGKYLRSQKGTINEYSFDAAFDEDSTQQQVYDATTKPFIQQVIDGYNVTVFAYGATGAGKTHTMMGNTRQDSSSANAEAGIIPNALYDIFALIAKERQKLVIGENWDVGVTFVEVYNEQVYDLLQPMGKCLSLREDKERGVVEIAGVAERAASNPHTVLELLQQGNRHRKTEATMANQVSSRSHAVLQLIVRRTRTTSTGRVSVVESKLSLIDLAGSERASATNNTGARLNEGANINKSLLALANCINALSEKSNPAKSGTVNVKFRDSKLTHLLRSSLEGNCSLIMIANINPSHKTYEDSHNTLKYANRAKNIKVDPHIVDQTKELNWVEREVRLLEENNSLKSQVAELQKMLKMLSEQPHHQSGCNAMDVCDEATETESIDKAPLVKKSTAPERSQQQSTHAAAPGRLAVIDESSDLPVMNFSESEPSKPRSAPSRRMSTRRASMAVKSLAPVEPTPVRPSVTSSSTNDVMSAKVTQASMRPVEPTPITAPASSEAANTRGSSARKRIRDAQEHTPVIDLDHEFDSCHETKKEKTVPVAPSASVVTTNSSNPEVEISLSTYFTADVNPETDDAAPKKRRVSAIPSRKSLAPISIHNDKMNQVAHHVEEAMDMVNQLNAMRSLRTLRTSMSGSDENKASSSDASVKSSISSLRSSRAHLENLKSFKGASVNDKIKQSVFPRKALATTSDNRIATGPSVSKSIADFGSSDLEDAVM